MQHSSLGNYQEHNIVWEMAGPTICEHCGKGEEFSPGWVGCDLCPSWYHKVCVYLQDVRPKDLAKVDWMCRPCKKKVVRAYQEHDKIVNELGKQVERLNVEREMLSKRNRDLEGKLEQSCNSTDLGDCLSKLVATTENMHQKMAEVKDEIVNTVVSMHASVWGDVLGEDESGATHAPVAGPRRNVLTNMKDELISTMVNLHASPVVKENVSDVKSYAAITKEKNLLVVKSTDKDNNVASRKTELAKVLKDVPVVDTRFTSGGNVVMNFASESERQAAANKISNGLKNLEMNFTKKLHPKIMICNVSKEESKEDIVEFLVAKNVYLQSLNNVHEKIKLVFDKPANGNTVHYILKCTPDVRRLIHNHGDVVCLKWARYNVRDRYHVFNCYFCQRYGHSENNCKFKSNGDVACCGKCAGNHPTKDCTVNTNDGAKCINCIRHSRDDVNHVVNSKQCKSLDAEMARVRNITDHGY